MVFSTTILYTAYLLLVHLVFKESEHIRAKIITNKEVTEQIKGLTTWDVGYHTQIKTNKIIYKGFNICIYIYIVCVCVCVCVAVSKSQHIKLSHEQCNLESEYFSYISILRTFQNSLISCKLASVEISHRHIP